VIAIDLRGIGGLSASANAYNAANMAKDVLDLSRALELRHPWSFGRILAGWSLMRSLALCRKPAVQ
jgi:hypothetical protein